jgi:hypothetical protein
MTTAELEGVLTSRMTKSGLSRFSSINCEASRTLISWLTDIEDGQTKKEWNWKPARHMILPHP